MRTRILLLAMLAAVAGATVAQAEPMTLMSAAFKDGGMLATKNAGNLKSNPNCVGENVSPEFHWSNVPANAKSLVLLGSDWEGGSGIGSQHLVVYNIAPSVTGFAEGELSKPSPKFTGGKESAGTALYRGPCPPAGSGNHHYNFVLIATDLEPGALPAGLTRDETIEKLKGHAKAAAGIVGLFGRP
jgi:hypothetical protein